MMESRKDEQPRWLRDVTSDRAVRWNHSPISGGPASCPGDSQSLWHLSLVTGRRIHQQGKYLAHWPEYFIVAEAPGGELMGYIMGKAEGSVAREEWHGHVTALSVAPEFRRLGLAAKLMELLEEISERKGGFFVDLFVRVSNQVAVNMYKQLGYSVYRTVIEYYSASNGEPDEDAYDMRKALSRDTEKKSIIPLPHPVRPEDIE
ncbi:N-alpha-acetyltransferase 20 isoform X2 [Hippopotamus amphibius kiboko]|uniref:N-alpha-acetyltransferase 20 isoform X2 n=1 Tax=Hippopotamus amphibius kiboko TaxID=575201 RepID=UPI0025964A73|nr:N-alpha-acetyltransferase 20 isoform X2 [Hippopotamus amphibius kiboko]